MGCCLLAGFAHQMLWACVSPARCASASHDFGQWTMLSHRLATIMSHFSHTTQREFVAHIALIEDNDDLRAAIAARLQSKGFFVKTYVCAEDFLLTGLSPRPNCLISDLHLPGMSGLALLEVLELRKEGLPTILMSASIMFTNWDNPLPPNCIGFLSKPFDSDVLFELVGKALNGQSGFLKLS